ncbi:hypothetical protein [Streptomyces tricolor]|uniref:hypothetical protein n=1 Tax=Streptomyces tricolor TaxID=68277 RepID=UPI0036DFEA50
MARNFVQHIASLFEIHRYLLRWRGQGHRPQASTPQPALAEALIYDLRTAQHFTLKQNPLTRSRLEEPDEDRAKRVETERFKSFTYDELIARETRTLTSPGCAIRVSTMSPAAIAERLEQTNADRHPSEGAEPDNKGNGQLEGEVIVGRVTNGVQQDRQLRPTSGNLSAVRFTLRPCDRLSKTFSVMRSYRTWS